MAEIIQKTELAERTKSALRIKTDDKGINQEVIDLIESAISDLKSSGIKENYDNNLYTQAIIFYCKSLFGFDNPDSTRFYDIYVNIKHKMMNMEEYREK